MVSSLHGNSNAELQDDKVISNFGDLALRPDIRPEILLRLSGKLQTTLDIHQLLEIFFKEMQPAVLVDGLTFNNPDRALFIQQGKNSVHCASYNIQTQKEHLGELVFHRSTRFREHELANIEGLLSALVYPMRNGLRYLEALSAAFRDPLTGAGNRVALEKTLTREMELSKRHGYDLSIMMIDFDHFKSVNDKHGHTIGDRVLKETVASIMSCIRQTDMCFRYGGEEFLIVLSNAGAQDMSAIADRIQSQVNNTVIEAPKGLLSVTLSIGCATYSEEDSYSSFVNRADEAMYAAKTNGRNQTVCDNDFLTCR